MTQVKLQLYCRQHGYVLVDRMEDACPECYPKRAWLSSVLIPAVGVGFAMGLATAELIAWVF